jgi:hypothetical protein
MKTKPTTAKARKTAKIIFVIPWNGEEVAAPDVDWLRGLVLRRGEDFWSSGSGEGWLKHASKATLTIAFARRKGFYLVFVDPADCYWIPLSKDLPPAKIPLWIGGDRIIVSKQFFVTREQAWAAVEKFCASGKRTKQIIWVRRNDVEWKYGYWEHPDVKLS